MTIRYTHDMPEYLEAYPDPREHTSHFLGYDSFVRQRASKEIKAVIAEQQEILKALQ